MPRLLTNTPITPSRNLALNCFGRRSCIEKFPLLITTSHKTVPLCVGSLQLSPLESSIRFPGDCLRIWQGGVPIDPSIIAQDFLISCYHQSPAGFYSVRGIFFISAEVLQRNGLALPKRLLSFWLSSIEIIGLGSRGLASSSTVEAVKSNTASTPLKWGTRSLRTHTTP